MAGVDQKVVLSKTLQIAIPRECTLFFSRLTFSLIEEKLMEVPYAYLQCCVQRIKNLGGKAVAQSERERVFVQA